MSRAPVSIGTRHLAVSDVDAIARRATSVIVSAEAREALLRSYAFLRSLVEKRVPVYGLTTGCGPLASQSIPPERREEFQRNLIRSHAVTLGAPHPTSFVRAAMAVRAHVLAQGDSGVD